MIKGHIEPFWDDEYIHLDYQREPFNDPDQIRDWKKAGYTQKYFVGKMCDIRKRQPSWNQQIIDYFQNTYKWNNVSTSYYLMETGVILPEHADLYARYKQVHELHHGQMIWRALVMLEDHKSGHCLEYNGIPVNWEAGDYFVWANDTKHMAANIGIENRYTLQITGWTE